MESHILDSQDTINSDVEGDIDPITDIIDYLVRCAKISFKNAHVDQKEVRTYEKIQTAHRLYEKSPTEFLTQFGKYLRSNHLEYFENKYIEGHRSPGFKECVMQLKKYHSEGSRLKRVRNRRYRALQKLQNESDYFSETQMMSRNPLLYEQLVGQYLTDKEIKERDGVDRENLTFLNLILDTVDRNQMRERKNEQLLEEELDAISLTDQPTTANNELLSTQHQRKKQWGEFDDQVKHKQWGDFDIKDTRPSFIPEVRKQSTISAPERRLLREEFLQEMYSSFIEGRDADVDYNSIDNNEQYDDMQQLNQDAEDQYFDSETNDVENLEEHMTLVQEYGNKMSSNTAGEDPLDVFMTHISNKIYQTAYTFPPLNIGLSTLSRQVGDCRP